MNKNEFSLLVSAIRTFYPAANILPNEQAMMLWYEMLKDLDYQTSEAAVKKWVATNKWPPTIADIREGASSVQSKGIKDWGEAWSDVKRAISEYGSYEAIKALDSLDELTRSAVKRIGFYDLCMSENQAADRANFRMIYEELAKREKEDRQLPDNVRLLISSIQERLEG